MTQARIVIADDHLLVAEGVANLLKAQFPDVTLVQNGHDLLQRVQTDPPELAIIDVALPLCNGLDAAREITRTAPGVKVIMLTMHKETDLVRQALLAGASAYVLKDSAGMELLKAAETVLKGGTYVSPAIEFSPTDFPQKCSPSAKAGAPDIRLTPRQKVVLQLLVEGKTNKEMADILKLSLKTVEFHKTRIMKSVGVRNTAELTQFALQHHLAIL
jgi:DNA-binding NarL/FixJ family response regulator